jgi:hypothetical protein
MLHVKHLGTIRGRNQTSFARSLRPCITAKAGRLNQYWREHLFSDMTV